MGVVTPLGYVYENHSSLSEYWSYHVSGTSEERTRYRSDISYWHRKGGVTKVPTEMIDGILPWRRPTTYHRWVMKYHIESGEYPAEVFNNGQENYTYTARGWKPYALMNDLSDFDTEHSGAGFYDSDASRQAITECLNKLGREKVQMGQFLAEVGKSANLVTSSAVDLLTLLRHVKRGNISAIPRDFGTIRKRTGDLWLRWKYGWQPLCADLADMHKDLLEKSCRPLIINAKRSIVSNWEYPTHIRGIPMEIKAKHIDTCQLYAKMSNELLQNIDEYGLLNPLSLTWELVPFSFVVDWFMPIGNTLEALTATSGLEFLGGYSSQVKTGKWTMQGEVGKAINEFHHFQRRAFPAFPSPQFYAVQKPIKPDRIATMLALLGQLR